MFRGTLKGSNLRLEEKSLNLRLEEELRSFVEPGPGYVHYSLEATVKRHPLSSCSMRSLYTG